MRENTGSTVSEFWCGWFRKASPGTGYNPQFRVVGTGVFCFSFLFWKVTDSSGEG